jgi:hypothetical protein
MFWLRGSTISLYKGPRRIVKEGSSTQVEPFDTDITEISGFTTISEHWEWDVVCVPCPEGSVIESIRIQATVFAKSHRDSILSEWCPSFAYTFLSPEIWKAALVDVHSLMAQSLCEFRIG